MGPFLQIVAGILLTAVLGIVLSRQSKDMAMLLTLAACCMMLIAVVGYLEPVMAFLKELEALGGMDGEMVLILLKALGIGLLGQIASLVCSDCGNSALGKGIEMLAAATVLWLALPMLRGLVELIQKLLGEL